MLTYYIASMCLNVAMCVVVEMLLCCLFCNLVYYSCWFSLLNFFCLLYDMFLCVRFVENSVESVENL